MITSTIEPVMICGNCGLSLRSYYKTCPNCGTEVNDSTIRRRYTDNPYSRF